MTLRKSNTKLEKHPFVRKFLSLLVLSVTICRQLPAQNCGIIITVAGDSTRGFFGDGGAASATSLNYPQCVTFDTSGNLYIADGDNHRVRKVTPSGIISTVAGIGTWGYSGDGGAATAAKLNLPAGIAFDAFGNLYVSDFGDHCVRMVTPSGTISTVAGNGIGGYSGDGGAATAAELDFPQGVAVDTMGNLYIADGGNNRVRKVTPSGIISTIAGDGTAGYAGDGGAATAAELHTPWGITLDAMDNVYVADAGNYCVRKVTQSGAISRVAGGGVAYGDGVPATAAALNPVGLCFDTSGDLYIANGGFNNIRKVTPAGIISTVAGNGVDGFSGDGSAAIAAELAEPISVSVDLSGNLYITDNNNHRVRKVGVCPASVSELAANQQSHYTIYPNPTTSILNISQSNPADVNLSTIIMNYLGQTVFAGDVAMRGGKGVLDVSGYAPGVYVVVFLSADGGKEQFKVVVE
jgi:trimeric autotransporter adhesin